MRRRALTIGLAGLLTLGGVAVWRVASTNPPTQPRPDSFTLIEQDLQAGLITIDQAAEYKVYALFASPRLPAKYQSDTPIPGDGTALFLEAVKDWENLSPETKQRVNDYITPVEIPQEAETVVALAQADLAQRLGIAESQIRMVAVQAVDWPDTSLGYPQPGIFYAQVITPGFRILLEAGGQMYEYHSDYTHVVFVAE